MARAHRSKSGRPKPPGGVPDVESPHHEIIEARFGKERALINFTIAQLRQTRAPDSDKIPMHLIGLGEEGWPEFRVPPWTISDEPSPHDAAASAKWNANVNSYSSSTFVADLHDTIALALHVNLDRDRYIAELRRQQPEMFATCLARLRALSG